MTDTASHFEGTRSDIILQLTSLIEGERSPLANMANMASLLYHSMRDVNWVGFYLLRGSELVLGPFQGMPACVRISVGKGVCGSSVERGETLIVGDVHAFPGHIACDPVSRSEIVIPMRHQEMIIGVLDLDSPRTERFSSEDAVFLATGLDLLVRGSFGWERFYSPEQD